MAGKRNKKGRYTPDPAAVPDQVVTTMRLNRDVFDAVNRRRTQLGMTRTAYFHWLFRRDTGLERASTKREDAGGIFG